MIGIVVVTHGNIADEMIKAMEHIVGTQQQVAGVSMSTCDDMELKRQEIADKVKETNSGDGVVIVTDMFGGTPSNLAISVMEQAPVEVIAGLNLPLLVKLTRERHKPLKEAVAEATEAGKKYINIASELLL
ncbi:MAG: PTS sugar transporter subunit IIA [Alphaproteobacteria bacterium]|nr:PTS sugar transporter subunit IIA [Alphaproteobacteria bacterium]